MYRNTTHTIHTEIQHTTYSTQHMSCFNFANVYITGVGTNKFTRGQKECTREKKRQLIFAFIFFSSIPPPASRSKLIPGVDVCGRHFDELKRIYGMLFCYLVTCVVSGAPRR